MTRTLSVLIVDDHPVVRKGIASLLSSRSDVAVVGEADRGVDAVAAYRRLQPDVVLLDIRLGSESGLDVLDEILEVDGSAKVVMLSSFDDEEYVMRSLGAGALGYLLKGDSDGILVNAILTASEGRRVLSPQVTDQIIVRMFGRPADDDRTGPDLDDMQLQVLRLVASGATNADIAEALFMSDRTVKRRLSEIFAVLGVDNRVEAAVEAARRGLI